MPPLIGEQPQQIVDRYMLQPDDADLLVCILWCRLGSPFIDATGRTWESGTAYEFETALRKYRRTGKRPIVLFYRCKRAVPPATDPAEISKVEQFLSRFHDPSSGWQGIFQHRSFETAEEFADLLKRDLREILEKSESPEHQADTPQTPLDALAQRVAQMWLQGVLEPSLESRPPIALPLVVPPGPELPNGVANCHTGVWLRALFRESKRRLLFTASAGAGKTIALLQLLRLLLQDRVGASGSPVPVVLDATSWRKGQSFRDWILHELDRLYGLRPKSAKLFVDTKQLICDFDRRARSNRLAGLCSR